jgi:hypothetical protein
VKHLLEGFVAFAGELAPRGLAVVAISANDVASYPQDSPAETSVRPGNPRASSA